MILFYYTVVHRGRGRVSHVGLALCSSGSDVRTILKSWLCVHVCVCCVVWWMCQGWNLIMKNWPLRHSASCCSARFSARVLDMCCIGPSEIKGECKECFTLEALFESRARLAKAWLNATVCAVIFNILPWFLRPQIKWHIDYFKPRVIDCMKLWCCKNATSVCKKYDSKSETIFV